jgi:Fe-S-cluster containining protein
MKVRALLSAILRARKKGLLRLRPVRAPMRFECLREECGLCCKYLTVSYLTPVERISLPILTKESGECEESRVPCVSSAAVCPLYSEGCTIHEDRPAACREYPWYNWNGRLYYDSGCPGLQRGNGDTPEPNSITSIHKYLPIARPIRELLLRVLRIW